MTNDITSYMIHKQGGKWLMYVWRDDKVDEVKEFDDRYGVAHAIEQDAHESDPEWLNFLKEQEERKLKQESEVGK